MFALNRTINSEEAASRHINVLGHLDDTTLLDKSGKLMQIIQLIGLPGATLDNQTLDAFKIRRNQLFKRFSSEFALYAWAVRRRVSPVLDGNFPAGFARDLNERYQQQLDNSQLFQTEHYLAVMTKPPEGIIHKGFSLLQWLSQRADKAAQARQRLEQHEALNEAVRRLLSALSDYDCRVLGVVQQNGTALSEPLSFLSQLVNGDAFSVPFEKKDASRLLPRKRLFFNSKAGTVELRAADGRKRFAALLSIKGYSASTYQGMLDALSHLRFDFTLTQSFRFYDRQMAKTRLRDQQHDMLQSQDESLSQTEEIDDAFDEAASGEAGYGKHHLTVACYADDIITLNQYVSETVACFADIDITCVREDAACEMAYWAQLPGNFRYVCRAADISTLNLAGLVSFHNTPRGKACGNHWGGAVTVLETLSGSPYHFNFHDRDVGNFLVYGAMGSGKTVLVGFLIAQSLRFGGKRIIFDKDRGLEILVRALGGVYDTLRPGRPTGFNPCRLPDTLENRHFLVGLLQKMLMATGRPLTETERTCLEQAVDGLYRLPTASRRLRHLAPFLGTRQPGSLRARFDAWHSGGQQAWLFDQADDTLDLSPDIIGIDIGALLADTTCKTPALLYLIHRLEQVLAGQRGLLFIDEGWLALDDDDFKTLIDNWSRTPRKKNHLFGLATQVANDTVKHGLGRSINESAFCKIFFPNPAADRRVYVDALGLTEAEFHQVKTLSADRHYFLLSHGRGADKQSVVVRLNLDGMEDLIAVISGREQTLQILDTVRAEAGDVPERWLPLFHARRRKV